MLTVQTICPVCKRPLAASYAERDGSVFFETRCPDHGAFSSVVAEQAEDYARWMERRSVAVPPKQAMTRGAHGATALFGGTGSEPENTECPLHCGTCENHLMTACCVLLDVTERCNQHCPYCFARAGDDAAADPSLEDIARKYERLLELGEERAFNIQLSGGEPTVRDDLPSIIEIGRKKGFEYIQLNTNGRRLGEEAGYADALKRAGLTTVFLQFDGTDDAIYTALRGEPLLDIKCAAIENCRKAGLPVTLVPTVVSGVNVTDIGNMVDFMLARLNVVKGIHFQPVSYFGRHPGVPDDPRDRVTMFAVMREIERQTGGRIRRDALVPISTGHQLCCFCSNFLRERNGALTSILSEAQKKEGVSCCCETEPDPLSVIRKDRDFVLNKWVVDADDAPAASSRLHDDGDESLSLDEALSYIKRNMFTISGMAFMDQSNLDAERLKRCRVQVFSEDERLIPFCAYNSVYRRRIRLD
ncbi:MAG: radical SAM protein [Clostridiales Family XIII bacterium]|jgi:uncharacterized radical SAM superfamily Fe-S cluster-containing enzyme|nr:radical SAM protein [Clostridiales Family XIII bacterium]